MRILHIFDHSIPLQSGYTFRSAAILKEQRRRGWETFQITGGKHGPVDSHLEVVDGLAFYRTPPSSPLVDRIPVLNQLAISHALYRRICEVVEEVQPDILHAHSPALNGLAAVRAAKNFSLPVVYEIRAFWEDAAVDHGTSTEKGLRYRATRALESYVTKRVNWVTTICVGLQQDLQRRGVPLERITVIPNAVNLQSFEFRRSRDRELEQRYELSGKPVLGFIGSFYAYEGVVSLISAMPAILESQPDLRLLLVGGGPCYQEALNKIKELGSEDNVICTGRVPHDQVQRFYSLVDIFCYPRLPMRLTELVTPLKPLEAMAMGKVIVASDVGGHRELIKSDETGYLYKSGSARELADTVIRAISAREHWDELQTNGRHFVENVRNWVNSVSKYEPIYERLLA